jgi:hypothetical protein
VPSPFPAPGGAAADIRGKELDKQKPSPVSPPATAASEPTPENYDYTDKRHPTFDAAVSSYKAGLNQLQGEYESRMEAIRKTGGANRSRQEKALDNEITQRKQSLFDSYFTKKVEPPAMQAGEIGVGPGAATAGNPEAFGKTGDYVSNMFAAINRDRAAMGKGPMPATQRRTWDEDNQKALAKMNREPDWIPRLINEVKDKPRPLLSWEQAGLVWHRDGLVTEAHNAMRKINQAFEDGRQDDLIQAKQDTARFEDEILALDDVVGRNGTGSEAGRSLNAQKMGAGEDFTLVQMVLEKRAKKGGRPLTDTERAQVEKEHAEYEQLVSERDAALQREKESQARIAEMEVKAALDKIALEAKQHPTYHPSIMAAAERIVVGFENRAKVASTKLREMLSRSSALVDPMIFKYVTEIGAAKIARFSLDSAKWAKAMLDEYGPKIEPYLKDGYEAAKQFLEANLSKVKSEQVKRAIKGTDLNERKADAIEKLKAKVEQGKLDEITTQVQKLARIAVEQGAKGWRAVTDAVHAELKEIIPDLDYRDTLDAITGHGKFKIPSQDAVSRELRDSKAQGNEVRKIQEVIARQPVKPTGLRRDVPSDIKRRLTKVYEEMKRRYGITVTDPATQLRSALQARKTYYTNRISDLLHEIEARKLTVRGKTESPTDPQLETLIAEYKKVKAEHDDIFTKPGLTDAQRLALAEKGVDRQIADIENQLKTGYIFPESKTAKLTSSALEAKRARLQALKDEREWARDLAQPQPEVEARENEARVKALDARIEELQRQLRTGEIFPKSKTVPNEATPEIARRQQQIDALKEERKYLRESLQPKPERDLEAMRLRAMKSRISSRTAELQEKLANGDFSARKQRPPVKLDAAALRTQANLNRWKVKYERAKALDENANKAWRQKVFEQVSGFAKASALSGYHTLGKLASYTAAKLIEKPITESAGYVFSKLPITRDIFKQTKFESPNIKALARYYTGFAREGMREAKQQFMTGESDIKATYGKPRVQPRKWYDFFGNLHASEKAPLRTGAFYSNLENAEAWALRNGLDPSDEFVQGALRWDSSVEADREILQENNAFANEVNGVIARLEKTEKVKDRLTGQVVEHSNATKSAIAAIFKTFVTKGIVKTPANYVMQSLEHSPAGLAFGITKAARAWKAGAENLHAFQADTIARLIKVGAVGSAMFVWGAIDATLSPDKRTFGGYYQPGDKRNQDDVLFGTIRIPGIANKQWTHIITHFPPTEAGQMGNTFMRVALSKLSKKDKENRGALEGVIAATIGLANQAPVAGSGLRLAKIQNPNEQSRVAGDLIKGLIPQLVQNIAEDTDATDDYRPPKTVGQDVELGVPGLRQNVPVKATPKPAAGKLP